MVAKAKKNADKTKPSDPNNVEAEPTKELLIQSLVKDIPLSRAIIDLVDNSVDGARAIRGTKRYSGLFVHLRISNDAFEIEDNCGGMSVEVAREYAFRFGRPTNMPRRLNTPHSVGQFGVGMKRAIFKLGRVFYVESRTKNSYFIVKENVDDWKTRKDADGNELWNFRFTPPVVEGDPQPPNERRGTTIKVTKLLSAVATEMNTDAFLTDLSSELSAAHELSMSKGLEIRLNGHLVAYEPSKLYKSTRIQPAKKRLSKTHDKSKIEIVLYAGIYRSKPSKAGGWYVYCNDRLILRADQTAITGWGENIGERIPKFHPQFARFRGFVFLDCDNPALLPWNTTKTGLDTDNELYKGVRREMNILGRPVIDFLNNLDREKNRVTRPLHGLVEKMDADEKTHVLLTNVKRSGAFVCPMPKAVEKPDSVDIKYKRPIRQVNVLKKFLGVTTAREVGEKTFDWVYELED
ncbi:MAG TPA: ATP-binding protein [Pyrinomonadaceae bacterium]|nr:ATP-binding protein [Pyrinomonadaceae bacterium]